MTRIISALKHCCTTVQYRGIKYFLYLISGYLYPNLCYHMFRFITPKKLVLLFKVGAFLLLISFSLLVFIRLINDPSLNSNWLVLLLSVTLVCLIIYQKYRFSKIIQARHLLNAFHTDMFTSWKNWPVSEDVRTNVENIIKTSPGKEIILGSIDNDGQILGFFGDLPNCKMVSKDNFKPRYRYPLDIVLLDGLILVRKNFCGDKKRFIKEWINLTTLTGKANVPSVYRVDEKLTIIYKNFILGRTIRDILVENGADILTKSTDTDPNLAHLTKNERLDAVLARGSSLLKQIFPDEFYIKMEEQINKIHREGITNLSLTFGNIMVDTQDFPWLIDFEGSKNFRSLNSPIFLWYRDQDRKKFSHIYNRKILTEKKARETLSNIKKEQFSLYAPVDFGKGLTAGQFWKVESGSGRWEYINGKVLASMVRGKRILDLGSNNGIMPLMMLREGAKEVIGLELDESMVETARTFHEIYEWRDMCRYNLNIYKEDMRAILTRDWGCFDIITAFCSLYYLSPEDMVRVIRRSTELAPIFVLQAKTDTRIDARDNKAAKSSLQYLTSLLVDNGYPLTRIFTPKGYSRPLIIGWHSNKINYDNACRTG